MNLLFNEVLIFAELNHMNGLAGLVPDASANIVELPMTSINQRPEPKSGVLDIDVYVPGKSAVPDGVQLRKLSSNETPLGASPMAIAAYRAAASNLQDYPDGSASALRGAIAQKYGLNADNIVCGTGSDELLSLLALAFLGPNDEAIYTEHGFLVYRINILAAGATPVIAAERDETAQVDEILNCITAKTKIVFLANPNNPTGTYLPIEEVRRLHQGLPANVLLVLDAAYAEYVHREDYEAGIELVSSFTNVVMTRTFSKIHGLAALRIGWLYGPTDVIDALNRVRGPFNVNSAAIAAGVAAIGDGAHVQNSVDHNNQWLKWTKQALEQLGLRVTPSVGNFLLIHFPEMAGKTAAEADNELVQNGYVLRRVGAYGFPNALRMTIGGREDNEGVIEILRRFLGGAQ